MKILVGINSWSTGDIYGSKTIVYETVMVDTYDYTIVKTHRICNTKRKLCCKHGLYVIMYQDWLINQNNMPH